MNLFLCSFSTLPRYGENGQVLIFDLKKKKKKILCATEWPSAGGEHSSFHDGLVPRGGDTSGPAWWPCLHLGCILNLFTTCLNTHHFCRLLSPSVQSVFTMLFVLGSTLCEYVSSRFICLCISLRNLKNKFFFLIAVCLCHLTYFCEDVRCHFKGYLEYKSTNPMSWLNTKTVINTALLIASSLTLSFFN